MGAREHHVVRVPALRLGHDVRVERRLLDAERLQGDGRLLAGRVEVVELLADGEAREHRRDLVARVRRAEERGGTARRVALVEQDDADGAGVTRQRELLREPTGAALDERDRAVDRRRVVLFLATGGRAARARYHDVVHRHHRRRHFCGRRVLERDEVDVRCAVVLRRAGDVGLGRRREPLEHGGRGLVPDRHVEHLVARVVACRLERLLDVRGGGRVPGRPGVARAAVGVGDLLERLLVLQHSFDGDPLLEPGRVDVRRLGRSGRRATRERGRDEGPQHGACCSHGSPPVSRCCGPLPTGPPDWPGSYRSPPPARRPGRSRRVTPAGRGRGALPRRGRAPRARAPHRRSGATCPARGRRRSPDPSCRAGRRRSARGRSPRRRARA